MYAVEVGFVVAHLVLWTIRLSDREEMLLAHHPNDGAEESIEV